MEQTINETKWYLKQMMSFKTEQAENKTINNFAFEIQWKMRQIRKLGQCFVDWKMEQQNLSIEKSFTFFTFCQVSDYFYSQIVFPFVNSYLGNPPCEQKRRKKTWEGI